MKTLSVQKFHTIIRKPLKKAIAIDVRSTGEYNSEHIDGVINIPLDQIKKSVSKHKKYQTVYVHCQSGGRSSQAWSQLSQLGLKNIVNIEGGIQAWKAKNYPFIKGEGMISIMRQVQITAGILVLLGVLIAEYNDPRFIWLSAFVGAGLLFSGVSGSCAMASILSKMPWNK